MEQRSRLCAVVIMGVFLAAGSDAAAFTGDQDDFTNLQEIQAATLILETPHRSQPPDGEDNGEP